MEQEVYTLTTANGSRFLPVTAEKEGMRKFTVLHPVFLLRSQAVEYSKLGIWKEKPKVVKAVLKIITNNGKDMEAPDAFERQGL